MGPSVVFIRPMKAGRRRRASIVSKGRLLVTSGVGGDRPRIETALRGLLLVLPLLLGQVPAAQAQVSVGIGVEMPGISIGINLPSFPDLQRVPGYPVYYAPGAPGNYFYYDGLYWVLQGDDWYASSWYNGPWQRVMPLYVPAYVLRVPVYYYRQPPPYFRVWRADAPPRWDEHWGPEWQQRRPGWNHWDRHAAPPPAPLPTYQRRYPPLSTSTTGRASPCRAKPTRGPVVPSRISKAGLHIRRSHGPRRRRCQGLSRLHSHVRSRMHSNPRGRRSGRKSHAHRTHQALRQHHKTGTSPVAAPKRPTADRTNWDDGNGHRAAIATRPIGRAHAHRRAFNPEIEQVRALRAWRHSSCRPASWRCKRRRQCRTSTHSSWMAARISRLAAAVRLAFVGKSAA